MWLINTRTLKLEEVSGDPIRKYAILSHTWKEGEEVSYHDFHDEPKREDQRGFEKIRLTCEQAQKDRLDYAWVDTCCIDKTSSAELSEAINSMFKWYRGAEVCYAYLSDVSKAEEKENRDLSHTRHSQFLESKWFTRGWTLQELIAPRKLIFYDSSWSAIGDKEDLTDDISERTGISSDILKGGDLSSVSVAKRMSWAASRKTRRDEDIAYCLMGIFDVNMPMLYGEGTKAFIRLQEEILKEIEDQSLYAWKASPESARAHPFRGILASSPDEFAGCDDIVPFRDLSSAPGAPTAVTAKGWPLTCTVDFPYVDRDAGGGRTALVGLNCRRGDDFENVVAIRANCQGGDRFLRSSPSELYSCSSHGAQETVFLAKAAHAERMTFLPELERQFSFYFTRLSNVVVVGVYPRDVQYNPKLRLIQLGPWVEDKAAVELRMPLAEERILLLLWATRPEHSREFEARFSLLEVGSHRVLSRIQQVKRPADHTSRLTVSLGNGLSRITASVSRRRIQGLDMFCVELEHYVVGYE